MRRGGGLGMQRNGTMRRGQVEGNSKGLFYRLCLQVQSTFNNGTVGNTRGPALHFQVPLTKDGEELDEQLDEEVSRRGVGVRY